MIYSSFSLFLIHLWIGFVSCAVYLIVPSPDHHCPVESCLTLSSFAANANLYLDNNTSLIFQPGNHAIRSTLNVTGIVEFSMISKSDQSRAGITCDFQNDSKAEFIFNSVSHVHISNLKFYECYCDSDSYNYYYYNHKSDSYFSFGQCYSITLTASSLVIVKLIFEDNVGTGMINAVHSNITIVQSTLKNNDCIDFHWTMLTFLYCNITIVSSAFIDNVGTLLLVRNYQYSGEISIIDMPNTLTIISCEFRNNSLSEKHFPILDVKACDILSIYDTNFIGNKADIILYVESAPVFITDNCTFKYNHGLAMDLRGCKVDIFNSVFNSNDNKAGTLNLLLSIIHIHDSEFKENVGVAIKCRGSRRFGANFITFSGICILVDNQAEYGGALYLGNQTECFVAHGATVIIANNTASVDGGGIYLRKSSNITLHSQSTLQILENRATNNGGGIFASELSSINLGFKSLTNISQTSKSTIYFHGNRAKLGGGLYLELNSVVYASSCLNNIINFDENLADFGGAVYVFTKAETTSQYNPDCFFQSQTLQNPVQNYSIDYGTIKCNKQVKPFHFLSNKVNYLGFGLYKEVFNNCSIGGRSFEEFELLNIVSSIQTSDVGSHLVQPCYCVDRLPDCSRQIPYINIKPGEKVILKVAIADRGNHIVNGSIESEIGGSVQIRDDQKIQDVINGCTSLIFDILYSFETSQQLIMSPWIENSSLYIIGSDKSIKINFLACISCPIGFQQIKDDARGCDCVCDVMKLGSHILTCNYTRETITKKGTTAWISYLSIKNTSDYLIFPYCPLDFCLPPDATVEINLNIPNGADAQCAHNHSGLLCRACSPGLSLSLGSSHCLPCHAHWPEILVAIIISSLLAGFILVASLLMLNLTIATGTLNGLIFYANIVSANQHKFFPSTNFISVFVSSLNLELGMDTCFFDGMDYYWKTWIKVAFPAYILLLVVLVIIVSDHSLKFAEIVAKGNPLATLNTLILLSYVKFLRTIILAFSFATLDYPDGSHPVVWWPDATVGYFSGKHIVLWAVAAIILVAGIFYTAILFSWQWLLYYQHKRIFKWIIRNQRLCMFVEPNHAPYAFKHRYWAGLLLLVRVIVYIISTADVSSDRTITPLAIGIITFFITVSVCSFQPFKHLPIQILEVTCYANIVCFCFATFCASKSGKSQDVIAYISGTTSLILFLIVLIYHIITQLFFATQLGQKLKKKLVQRFSDTENEDQVNLVVQNKNNDEPVTYSVVDPPTRGEEEPQSHPDIPRSRRNTTNNVLESAGYEENELKPIEQRVTDSSIPYILMK